MYPLYYLTTVGLCQWNGGYHLSFLVPAADQETLMLVKGLGFP